MRVLVLGGGGREHAIADSLSRSRLEPELLCAPGNAGTAAVAKNVSIEQGDPARVAEWAVRESVDLVVVGPEAPLVAGVADALAERGVPVFGPKASGARIEGSKAFAKEMMDRHGIPTARYRLARTYKEAAAHIEELGAPVVVKADGLAAGKGVTVAETFDDALRAAQQCLNGAFGPAGSNVVIEEFLEGPECSLLAFTDGETVLPMVPAQDHKRAFDGDKGPNTGGMGVYAPVPAVDQAAYDAMSSILKRTVRALRDEGVEYRGVLYGGFILTPEGPKVLEFNARFGDPETQVLLPLLETDLLDVFLAVADARLHDVELHWRNEVAVSVVLASGGYPGVYETGKVIKGLEEAERIEGVTVYHAGTALGDKGEVLTAGGRVLDVTAVAPSFAEARDRAYRAVRAISFEGMQYRTDIGSKAIETEGSR